MNERKKNAPIPEFHSYAEEAAFWDTHSLADYWDESKKPRGRSARNLSEGITIRLDPETLRRLRSLAEQQGLGPTTLARMWILEHLTKTVEDKSVS